MALSELWLGFTGLCGGVYTISLEWQILGEDQLWTVSWNALCPTERCLACRTTTKYYVPMYYCHSLTFGYNLASVNTEFPNTPLCQIKQIFSIPHLTWPPRKIDFLVLEGLGRGRFCQMDGSLRWPPRLLAFLSLCSQWWALSMAWPPVSAGTTLCFPRCGRSNRGYSQP